MGKFRQFLTELSARDTPFPDYNLSNLQGHLTKLAICIDIIKICFRIVICSLILSTSGLGLLSVSPSFTFPTFSQQ